MKNIFAEFHPFNIGGCFQSESVLKNILDTEPILRSDSGKMAAHHQKGTEMTKRVYAPSVPTRHDPVLGSRVPSIDLRPATHFGELCVLVNDLLMLSPDNIDDALETVQRGLANIHPDDYVLAVGDPIMIAAAIAYACDNNGSVKVLRWNRLATAYQEIEVTL